MYGNTNTAAALRMARMDLFTPQHGDRPGMLKRRVRVCIKVILLSISIACFWIICFFINSCLMFFLD